MAIKNSYSYSYIVQGRIQDFKLGGVNFKKLRRAEGGAKNVGNISRTDGPTNGLTDGRPAFPYPPLRFAGAGDKKVRENRINNKTNKKTKTEKQNKTKNPTTK